MTTAIKVSALSLAIAAALFFTWVGANIVNIINADYKDSKDSTYLIAGGIFLTFALTVVIATLGSGLPQSMSRNSILLSLPIGAVLGAGLIAYLYYGSPSDPPGPGYHRSPPLETTAPGLDPGLATPSVGTPLPVR